MSANKVATSYKQADNEYVKGIETAHGRIKLLYETLLSNLNKIEDKHKDRFYKFRKMSKSEFIIIFLNGERKRSSTKSQ